MPVLPWTPSDLRFQVSVVGDTVNKAGQTSAQAVRVPEERLAEDLRSLLERNSYTDVTLRTIVDKTQGHPGFQEFRAHKAILAGEFFKLYRRFHVATGSEGSRVKPLIFSNVPVF